jgi:hypothetical protein
MLEEEKSHSTVKRGSENRPTVLGRGRAIWSLGRTHFISPQSFLEVLPPLSKPSYEKPQERFSGFQLKVVLIKTLTILQV